MEKFAFIIHPLEVSDIARKFSFAGKLPPALIERLMQVIPPLKVSHITGVRSQHGEAEGWFLGCPLTARLMMELPEEYVMKKIIKTAREAEKLGARIVGLGAFTAVVGDAGETVAKNLNIAVTTGNSYTIAAALEGTKRAASLMGHDLKNAKVAVIGATGSIGRVCATVLARDVTDLTLVARNRDALNKVADGILNDIGLAVKATPNVRKALLGADIIITVTSAVDTVIEPGDLKPGAVVCDVARPRDVSKQVIEKRDDVLVLEGGVIEVPGNVRFNFNFGFPAGKAYACMAETMILALEGKYENFSLGREITLEQVSEISRLARKHDFKLAGLRSFERAITDEEILGIKERAWHNKKEWDRMHAI